ncbi:MAG TPA: hypothetical protein VKI44_08570 [Acetobacteraceae bacterium]|nr:hypothetical protein [Acetobacteraceae bacterium]
MKTLDLVTEAKAIQVEQDALEAEAEAQGTGTLTWPQRITAYEKKTGRPAFLTFTDGLRPWLYGVWLQNDYAVRSGYYGGYPGDYLKRIAALFPDKRRVLHVFSGMVDTSILPGDTLDVRAELKPTYCVNAETCAGVPLDRYDLAVCDPPYSENDAVQYGTSLPVAGRVMRALEGLPAGAHVVWLDERTPRSRKVAFAHEGIIGLSTSAGHRFRVVNVFRRHNGQDHDHDHD